MSTIHMDVVVIGSGITGTSIAYALARRGVRNVLLLDQRMTAGSTTRGAFGIVRTYHASRVMVSMARRSLRLYEQFEEENGGAAAFVRTGLLVLVPAGEQEMLEANVGVATHLGSTVQVLATSDAVRSVEPRINLDGVAAAAWEPGAGYGDPTQTSAAFAIRARDLGVQVRQGIRILNVDTAGEAGDQR
ncbi:MAG: FAD-binding oxidoreductase, partial [Thermomicrobia bacterium]|nr:FAD-binding oxidoreductase [Thermomicrobia bacterium]